MAQVEVTKDEGAHRYVATVGGERAAYLSYQDSDDAVDLVHTVVRSAYEGKGVGGALVRQTLDLVRADGKQVVATCPFVRAWISKHPEYADLVDG